MKENIYKAGAVVFSYYMLENRKTGHYHVKNLVIFSCIVPICAESKLLHDYLLELGVGRKIPMKGCCAGI